MCGGRIRGGVEKCVRVWAVGEMWSEVWGSVLGCGRVVGSVGECGEVKGDRGSVREARKTPTRFLPHLSPHFSTPQHFLSPPTTPQHFPIPQHTFPHLLQQFPTSSPTRQHTFPNIPPHTFHQPSHSSHVLSHNSLHTSPCTFSHPHTSPLTSPTTQLTFSHFPLHFLCYRGLCCNCSTRPVVDCLMKNSASVNRKNQNFLTSILSAETQKFYL